MSARSGQLQNWEGKYGAAIKNVASNILKDTQDAEEAVSDTYLTVWNRIPPAKPKYLGAYSCRIARNLSLKRLYANTAEKRNSYAFSSTNDIHNTSNAKIDGEIVWDTFVSVGTVDGKPYSCFTRRAYPAPIFCAEKLEMPFPIVVKDVITRLFSLTAAE